MSLLYSVKPGERIAVDGVVSEGSSYVDESMLSGEPLPVRKQKGAKVFAGTINQKGAFRFVADKIGQDTLLAQIIRMVQDAQGSKAPVQKLVDKIASVFVPTIITIALISFVAWMVLAPENGFTHGILALVTVLIQRSLLKSFKLMIQIIDCYHYVKIISEQFVLLLVLTE